MQRRQHLWEVAEHGVEQCHGRWHRYVTANQTQGIVVVGLQELKLCAKCFECRFARGRSWMRLNVGDRLIERWTPSL